MLAPPPLPRTLAAAIRDLESARPEVRASAISDLVHHAKVDDVVRARALSLFEDRLRDADPRVRSSACIAFADLGGHERIDALLLAVDDDDAHVRQMALCALGEIRDERALGRLKRALGDRRAEVRYQGIIAFSRVCRDDATVAQALFDATNDDDDAVVHIALRLAEERLDAVRAGRSSSPLVDPRLLVRARVLLRAPSSSIALVAAILLAKAGETDGHALIRKVARSDHGLDLEKEEEQAAVELAGELGMTDAIPDLERRVWGLARLLRDTCSFHARIALARMGHARAVDEVLRDLGARRAAVRASAVVAAGRARVVAARPILERLPEGAVDRELVDEALDRLSAD